MTKQYKNTQNVQTHKLLIGMILLMLLVSTAFVVLTPDTYAAYAFVQETQRANETISANQILKQWQNESNQIGVGTVLDVTCRLEEFGDGQTIFSYAQILVNVPLTSNLNAKQTIVAKYLGGQVDNQALRVDFLWPYFPDDTITPPCVYRLSKGQSVMFFAKEDAKVLTGYISYATIDAAANEDAPMVLTAESQPTTGIAESAGHGFAANFDTYGDYIPWSSMPWHYQFDSDGGTADIAGSQEFDAVRAAFDTWEDDPFSAIAFYEESSQFDPGDDVQSYTHRDYHNSVGCIPNFQGYGNPNAAGFCWSFPVTDPGHIVETDIAFNDALDGKLNWAIGVVLGGLDVQSVATHEIGHALGLADLDYSSNSIETMHPPITLLTIGHRSIEWGDRNGVHYLYPEHADAGLVGDASDTCVGATLIQTNQEYTGRLCYLPGDIDANDYYQFYIAAGATITIYLNMQAYADFSLELRDSNNMLYDYSSNSGAGYQEIIVFQIPTGISGYWRIRVFSYESDPQLDSGEYSLMISDFTSKYISSVTWSGGLRGSGTVFGENDIVGSSPNTYCAEIYCPGNGDAAAIIGYLNAQVSGTSNIYVYGCRDWEGDAYIDVYVAQNGNNDWVSVATNFYVNPTSQETIHVGSTTQSYRYVCISVYNNQYYNPAIVYVDCVIATS